MDFKWNSFIYILLINMEYMYFIRTLFKLHWNFIHSIILSYLSLKHSEIFWNKAWTLYIIKNLIISISCHLHFYITLIISWLKKMKLNFFKFFLSTLLTIQINLTNIIYKTSNKYNRSIYFGYLLLIFFLS